MRCSRGDTRDRAEPVRAFEAGEAMLFLISLNGRGAEPHGRRHVRGPELEPPRRKADLATIALSEEGELAGLEVDDVAVLFGADGDRLAA